MTDKKTYEMVYECTNCHTTTYMSIPVGEIAPRDPDLKCRYCGCDHFYNPRKPKQGDYAED